MTQMTQKNEQNKKINCLDKGFIALVDQMGNDQSIVDAARVSYGKGTKSLSDNRNLIRYLLRNKHTTPFEMVVFRFHIKAPIFVARQWMRHRMSSISEESLRYSEPSDDMYYPENSRWKEQSTTNKQGSSTVSNYTETVIDNLNTTLTNVYKSIKDSYFSFNNFNVARELSRIILPVGSYTEWHWKIDLHNLFHFLKLRLDSHAQHEIRVYAEAILDLISDVVPISLEAFNSYQRYSNNFSKEEMDILYELLNTVEKSTYDSVINNSTNNFSKRELSEFIEKIKK